MRVLTSFIFYCGIFVATALGKKYLGKPIITCNSKTMTIDLKGDEELDAYVDDFSGFKECQATRINNSLQFKIPLKGSHCGIQKVKHLVLGKTVYYTTLIIHKITTSHDVIREDKVTVLCEVLNYHHHRVRRQEILPPDFEEDRNVTINRTYISSAPGPKVTMTIRKNGNPISFKYSEEVGTSLTLDFELDDSSKKGYGMLIQNISATTVGTDLIKPLLINGCPFQKAVFQKPVVEVSPGHLQIPFQAFRFKFGSFLKLTVNISFCLGKCNPIHCDEGDSYGRKKRTLADQSRHLRDVSLETVISLIPNSNHNKVIQSGFSDV